MEPDVASRASVVAETRIELGTGDRADLDLALLATGVEWRVAPTLAARATMLALVPFGDANPGGGGELSLRLAPLPDGPLRPILASSAGILFFPTDPFLGGGDVYEFVLSSSAGAELDLGERWAVSAEVVATHLSNGQGLGPHNPAFDGIGFVVGVRHALAPRVPFPGPWEGHVDVDPPNPRLVLEASVGQVADSLLVPGRVRVAQDLGESLLVLFDVEGGTLAGDAYGEGGVALVAHPGVVTVGAHAGYRNYAGIDVLVLTLQPEVHVTPEVTLVAMGHHERAIYFGDTWRAGAGVRFFPLESLFIELGLGLEGIGTGSPANVSDPYFAFEWRLPQGERPWNASVYLERQVSTISAVGLRFSWGAGLRDFVRGTGWRRLR